MRRCLTENDKFDTVEVYITSDLQSAFAVDFRSLPQINTVRLFQRKRSGSNSLNCERRMRREFHQNQ